MVVWWSNFSNCFLLTVNPSIKAGNQQMKLNGMRKFCRLNLPSDWLADTTVYDSCVYFFWRICLVPVSTRPLLSSPVLLTPARVYLLHLLGPKQHILNRMRGDRAWHMAQNERRQSMAHGTEWEETEHGTWHRMRGDRAWHMAQNERRQSMAHGTKWEETEHGTEWEETKHGTWHRMRGDRAWHMAQNERRQSMAHGTEWEETEHGTWHRMRGDRAWHMAQNERRPSMAHGTEWEETEHGTWHRMRGDRAWDSAQKQCSHYKSNVLVLSKAMFLLQNNTEAMFLLQKLCSHSPKSNVLLTKAMFSAVSSIWTNIPCYSYAVILVTT